MKQIIQNIPHNQGKKTENWTPDEDQKLIGRVESGVFSKWIEVASIFPNRSAHACRARYAFLKKIISNLPRLQFEDPVKWTTEEDQLLLTQLVKKTPWNQIYKSFPHRTKVACNTRARVLKIRHPELAKTVLLKKQRAWSKEEEQKLIKLVVSNQFLTWKDVASHLPNRTVEAIRKHYKNLKKLNPELPPLNNGRLNLWSEEEDRKLILSVVSGKYCGWDDISKLFQNKSAIECQRHYRTLQNNNPHLPSLLFVMNKIRPKLENSKK